MAPFDGKYMMANQMQKSLTLNMKVKIRRKTGLAPFDWKCFISYKRFFRILATWEHTFMQTGQTRMSLAVHVYTNVYVTTQKQVVNVLQMFMLELVIKMLEMLQPKSWS